MNAPTPPGVAWRPTASIEALRLRAALLARTRQYFADTGALEVETPALVLAAVTDAHLESLRVVDDASRTEAGFLHTSPEYAMKRLLCAGAPDIYQVCRVFRAGERGRRHNLEFTMIEWYRLGIDHRELMRDVERLLRALLSPHRAAGPSDYVSYCEAFQRALGIDPLESPLETIVAALERNGVDLPASMRDGAATRDDVLDLGMGTVVAASFAPERLTFLYDFPASQAALAQVRGPVASRFEAFWGSLELANGFHELGSADEQAARFEADLARRGEHGQPLRVTDARFLAALAHGLPPCAGVALGFDRVVMGAAGAASIDDVIAFPHERA
jgi:lysyl-tRNA synthetase class 2